MTKDEVELDEPETDEDELEGEEQEVSPVEVLSKEDRFKAKLKEAVLVERQEMGPLRLKLTVTIPRETLDERFHEEFQELKRDALVPGFRKGHAPLKLVEKRFGTDVGDQIKTQFIANGYMAAVEKEDLKPLGDPLFFVKVKDELAADRQSRETETDKLLPLDQALESMELPKEGPLSFACELELKPQFELPNLDGIPVRRPKVTITDKDVDAEVNRVCMGRATFQPVNDGKVEANDLLYGEVKLTADGQKVSDETNAELAARDIEYKGINLVGFGKAVVGKGQGKTVVVKAAAEDDHEDLALRGKSVQVEFTIREIKRLNVPPLDKTLLESLGCDDEEDLRKYVRSMLEASLEETLQKAMGNQVAEYLLTNTKMEIPERSSQRQTGRAIARRMIEMYQANVPQAEIAKQMDEWRVKAQEQVARDLKLYFILEKIAEDMNIDVAEEELNSAVASMARRSNQRFDRVRDELIKTDRLSTLFLFMRDQKVLDTLVEKAEVTEVDGPETTKPT